MTAIGSATRPSPARSGRRVSSGCRAAMSGPCGEDSGRVFSMSASSPPPPDAPPRGVYRPSALIRGSVALHLAAAAGLALRPALWPWALGAVVADHLALTAAGLVPRSRLLGANWTRLPAAAAARGEIAITIDDGPDPEVTPAVLALLERQGVRASFFCVGERVARFPQLARDIVARGHSIENHSE